MAGRASDEAAIPPHQLHVTTPHQLLQPPPPLTHPPVPADSTPSPAVPPTSVHNPHHPSPTPSNSQPQPSDVSQSPVDSSSHKHLPPMHQDMPPSQLSEPHAPHLQQPSTHHLQAHPPQPKPAGEEREQRPSSPPPSIVEMPNQPQLASSSLQTSTLSASNNKPDICSKNAQNDKSPPKPEDQSFSGADPPSSTLSLAPTRKEKARIASVMLKQDDVSDQTKVDNFGDTISAKRRNVDVGRVSPSAETSGLLQGSPSLSNPFESPVQPDAAPSIPPNPKLASVPKRTSQATAQVNVPSATSTGSVLPLLRSSPVSREDKPNATQGPSTVLVSSAPAPASKVASGDNNEGTAEGRTHVKTVSESTADPAAELGVKKVRRVSWAPKEKLIDIHFIDSRAELVRTWDPDSQITLPFAPSTLQALKSDGRGEDSGHADSNNSLLLTAGTGAEGQGHGIARVNSFEAARKREVEMELERARKARDDLQSRLNSMSPTCRWRRPTAVVLPAECRMDSEILEPFTMIDVELSPNGARPLSTSEAYSPQSPPPSFMALGQLRDEDPYIPNIPLSDGCNDPQSNSSAGSDNLKTSRSNLTPPQDFGYASRSKNDGYAGGGDMHMNTASGEMRVARPPASEVGITNRPKLAGENLGGTNLPVPNAHARWGNSGLRSEAGTKHPEDKGSIPLPPHAMQHLLSALQSSGLLRPTNDGSYAGSSPSRSNARVNDNALDGNGYHDPTPLGEDGLIRSGMETATARMEDEQREVEHHGSNLALPSSSVPPVSSSDVPPGAHPLIGHAQQMPMAFGGGGQQAGMLDCMPFPMPPMPPPPLGLPPNLMPLGMGVPMPMGLPMGIPLNMPPPPMAMNQQAPSQGVSPAVSTGRNVETISRPKTKPSKQRKRCKYFGTKQGCRDGSSCMFAHN